MFASCVENIYEVNDTTTFNSMVVRATFRGLGSNRIRLIDLKSIPLFHARYGAKIPDTNFDFDKSSFLIRAYPCLINLIVMVFKHASKVPKAAAVYFSSG